MLAAVVLATAASGGAEAKKLSLSGGASAISWSSLTFSGLGGLITIRCPVSVAGSFHSATIAKVRGSLIGNVTGAILDQSRCTGGTATLLNGTERLPSGSTAANTLPWHIIYDSFTGTLPNITGVRVGLVGLALLVNVSILGSTVSCLYLATAREPAFGTALLEAGRVTGLRAEEGTSVPVATGQPGACPSRGSFSGTATVPSTTIRLI
ncbi:MAG TPA: hypothetical protein VFV85_04125 [Conexibacter sp.]|nr:hypothetical protein [Conexibacter sp.]